MDQIEKKLMGMRIKKGRERAGLSQDKLAEMLGMKRTNIANYEAGRVTPPSNVLKDLCDIFNTTADYLLGRSLLAVIEKRLSELNMTYEDVERAMEWPRGMLESIDTFPPMPWDFERGDMIDKLSKILNMDYNILASAYSLQEPPAYDGPKTSIPEEFKSPNTIAAHHDGEDWTEEELEEIEKFKEFIKSKRKK